MKIEEKEKKTIVKIRTSLLVANTKGVTRQQTNGYESTVETAMKFFFRYSHMNKMILK